MVKVQTLFWHKNTHFVTPGVGATPLPNDKQIKKSYAHVEIYRNNIDDMAINKYVYGVRSC